MHAWLHVLLPLKFVLGCKRQVFLYFRLLRVCLSLSSSIISFQLINEVQSYNSVFPALKS